MDVSIIIVNYNTLQLTRNCLLSIIEHTKEVEFEVIIVDNASTDGSAETLSDEFQNFLVIENKENIGFGRGNNIGINHAQGKYIFLLNSDTILKNNAVKKFYSYMETYNKNNSIGAIGCLLKDINMSVSRSSSKLPSLGNFLKDTIKGYYSRFLLRNSTSFIQELIPNNRNEIEVGAIVGADMFIPAKVLLQIGLFDPVFFMYFEETDLQKRMDIESLKRFLIRGPEIIHFEGQSNTSIKKYIIFYKSMLLYTKKHLL